MDKNITRITSDKKPLISICATFFNGERCIRRLLDSCLNQTYKNIEIVILDDGSTDDSEKIMREYMARDSRIKYFKNNERTWLAESLLKVFKLAKGDFAVWVGADDWLARDYIENGVRVFLEHPEIAGVVPDLTVLLEHENGNGVFTFQCRKHFLSGVHPAEWFVKRMYKPTHLYISGFALVRSKDLVSAMDYHVKNYYRNPSESVPEELREFFRRAFGIDTAFFLEILSRYKNFAFDGSLNYIKIGHWKNQFFNLRQAESLSEIFKDAYYRLLIYTYIYKSKWPKFYGRMKIFRGAEVLSTAFLHFLRCGMRPSFLDFSKGRKVIFDFFSELSLFEIVVAILYSIPMAAYRCLDFMGRKFIGRGKQKAEDFSVFTRENFLDSERRFKVS